MDSPIELVQNALEGDIEIAGKRIPKIALVGGGAVILVIIILLSRRGGSARSISPNGVLAGDSTGSGGSTNLGDSGGGVGGVDTGSSNPFDAQAFQDSIAQQLADQSSSLTDLIAQNNQSQSDQLSSSLASVYDQLASVGSVAAGGYGDSYTPVPIDGGYSLPVDTGIAAYPQTSGYDIASVAPQKPSGVVAAIDRLKPSTPKQKGGAKLGAALSRSKSGDNKVNQLSHATKPPKPTLPSGGVLNFNKQGLNKQNATLNKQQKQPLMASPFPIISSQKGKNGQQPNGKPIAISKNPVGVPTTIKTSLVSGVSKTGKIPQAAQPTHVGKQGYKPNNTAQPKQGYSSQYKPSYRPAPIPVYTPYMPTYSNPFRTFSSYGKISSKTYKKGR